MMTVSLCVVAYNEENILPRLLRDLEAQTYDHSRTEIVLIDGRSTDKTRELMEAFARVATSFSRVAVVDNEKRIQAAGWNLAIEHSTGDVIIRIDAHTHIPPDFTAKNMALQEKGEYVSGGIRPCIIEDESPWRQTLLEVENSLFGSSIGASRRGGSARYVKTMFHAAYRREVFDTVGRFNEGLLRTEDNEMHYRIRQAGYRLYCDPDIISYQYARSSLSRMWRQKYGNGFWVGETLKICPRCISLYHLVPLVFIFGIVFTTLLGCFSSWYLAGFMWSAYLIFALAGVMSTVLCGKANRWTFLMPLLFLMLHIGYGVGTAEGLLKKI